MDSGKGFLGTCEPHCPVALCSINANEAQRTHPSCQASAKRRQVIPRHHPITAITAITMGVIASDAGLTPQDFTKR
jgi:hypothetical protein